MSHYSDYIYNKKETPFPRCFSPFPSPGGLPRPFFPPASLFWTGGSPHALFLFFRGRWLTFFGGVISTLCLAAYARLFGNSPSCQVRQSARESTMLSSFRDYDVVGFFFSFPAPFYLMAALLSFRNSIRRSTRLNDASYNPGSTSRLPRILTVEYTITE
jgi:hypothetical protein